MEEELLLLLDSDEELGELSLADLVAVSDFESVDDLESPEEWESEGFESDEDELSLEPLLLSDGVFGLP
ncbi:hypothetical protein MGWOODY_Clf1512 [hydrothermal vent metagenome]|uniref:Uncharacterized protein n=1 Tax=hydrothermal vent metagenome TaxID=652676 RepID=A0A170QA83_9ZZZZ